MFNTREFWQARYLYLFIYVSVCMPICLSICRSVYLYIYPPIYLSVCLSIYLSTVNLSRADTYGTEVFIRFREMSSWRDSNWKVPKFKVQLFYTGPTLTRTPPPLHLTMGMWDGEKEVIFFVIYQFILYQRLK